MLYSRVPVSQSQQGIVVPNRQSFKPAEVCELLKVQPYVLRTWEQEFKELGVAKGGDGPRVYRRRDVELAVRIRQLVFDEGLTLAGARRRLESERPPEPDPEFEPDGDTVAITQQAVVIIDFTKESPVGPPPASRLAASEVKAEMQRAGYALAREHSFLPNQYFLVFRPR